MKGVESENIYNFRAFKDQAFPLTSHSSLKVYNVCGKTDYDATERILSSVVTH